MRASGDGDEDRLEQVRLAGTVRAGDDREAGLGVELRAGIAAEVLEEESGQAHPALPTTRSDRHDDVHVVLLADAAMTPGANGPESSSAACSAPRLLSTSMR
jgi:hypothetical protein